MTNNQNITQAERELERLRKLVYYDELTGLFNRRGFMEEAEHQFKLVSFGTTGVERRTGFQIPFGIIFFDLDDFKHINDTYGHIVGDQALKTVAEILHKELRRGDLYGRLGGEEFAVALLGATAAHASVTAEKLRAAISASQFIASGKRINLTGSFGIAIYSKEKTLNELIEHADKAMYKAKRSGKNKVSVYS